MVVRLSVSTVVEQSSHHPKVKGSTATSGTEKEKNDEHKFFQDVYDVSKPSHIIQVVDIFVKVNGLAYFSGA